MPKRKGSSRKNRTTAIGEYLTTLRVSQGKTQQEIADSIGKDKSCICKIERGKRDAEREKQRIVANAKLQARKLGLDAKEDVIKEAFGAAEAKLRKISSGKEYSSVLEALIKEAQAVVNSDVEIIARAGDSKVLTSDYIKKLSKDTKAKIEVSDSTVETIGGAIVKAKDGKIEVNNTIEMRMERMRGDMRPKVAKALFVEA